MIGHQYLVVKASGKEEPFSEEKLRHSLARAGADQVAVDAIVARIYGELHDGITTTHIYKRAFELLKKRGKKTALRYGLRQAVMQLGPTGFPFEKFVGELLSARGYAVQTGVIMKGFCVDHEVDVLAIKENKHIMIEAKFHNSLGIKTDVKVALYTQARFEDLKKKRDVQNGGRHEHKEDDIHEAWLITNTKLTSEAIAYGACKGLRTIGWNHPRGEGLQDMIVESGMHPLTCLTTLSSTHKKNLFNQGITLCKDLAQNEKALHAVGVKGAKVSDVFKEITLVCTPDNFEKKHDAREE